MSPHDARRAAELLVAYWRGSRTLDLGTRERCRRLSDLLADSPALAEAAREGSSQAVDRTRAGVEALLRSTPAARDLVPGSTEPEPGRGAPEAGSNVRVRGSHNQVVAVGGGFQGSLVQGGAAPDRAGGDRDGGGVLFLAADPARETSSPRQDPGDRLRLDREAREIEEALRLAGSRVSFEQRWAVRSHDVTRALLQLEPRIVHFSGHGTATGKLCVEDRVGFAQLVPAEALAGLFSAFDGDVECVVLNACDSEKQARAIARHVPYVVGMRSEIGDRAAIAFSVGFYQAIGAGSSVPRAFRLGCSQIQLQGLSESPIPVLIERERPGA